MQMGACCEIAPLYTLVNKIPEAMPLRGFVFFVWRGFGGDITGRHFPM